jgi:hypothetical protein
VLSVSDDDYRRYVARRFDLSEVTEDLSKLDGKVLALATLMRCFVFCRPTSMDMVLAQDDVEKAKYVAGILAFAGLSLSESNLGLPYQLQKNGPYFVGPTRNRDV